MNGREGEWGYRGEGPTKEWDLLWMTRGSLGSEEIVEEEEEEGLVGGLCGVKGPKTSEKSKS